MKTYPINTSTSEYQLTEIRKHDHLSLEFRPNADKREKFQDCADVQRVLDLLASLCGGEATLETWVDMPLTLFDALGGFDFTRYEYRVVDKTYDPDPELFIGVVTDSEGDQLALAVRRDRGTLVENLRADMASVSGEALKMHIHRYVLAD